MKTETLIDRLSDNLTPVPRAAALRTLALDLAAGGAASAVVMLATLGLRPDLFAAVASWPFWMKLFYTALFALMAFFTFDRLARPGGRARRQAALEAAPFAVVAAAAIVQWAVAPPARHLQLLLGASHTVCPWRIVVLALPVFVGVLWSMRKLAPTRPTLAGTAAGLLSGAAGATIYSFACTESSVVFVAVWYTLGIALMGLLGALIGRWALRW
jgi:hypothetical protein